MNKIDPKLKRTEQASKTKTKNKKQTKKKIKKIKSSTLHVFSTKTPSDLPSF